MFPWTCDLGRQISSPSRCQWSGRADSTTSCTGAPPECKILSREARMSGQSCNKAVSFADWEWRMALTHATACALSVKLSSFPASWCKCASALETEVSLRFGEGIRGFKCQCWDAVERLDVLGAGFFHISQVRHRKLLFSSHLLWTLWRSNLTMM